MASLGSLVFHRDAKGNLGVSLTDIGRWLFGRKDRWTLPSSARPVAVVGGDFTVTLLEPAPDLELELVAFAEPVAGGSAFRLTRHSVQEAAHKGLPAEAMLKVLKDWSKHALPGNVIHEVEAWAVGRKGVTLSEAVLLEGDDPVAVAEILEAFPKDFERVAPTVLKYLGGSKKAVLLKRLAKKGFFAS